MTTDEKSENFEIIIPIWNRCKPDHLCNRGVKVLLRLRSHYEEFRIEAILIQTRLDEGLESAEL